MGSITSRPKAPPVQYVYVPAPTPAPVPSPTSQDPQPPVKSNDEIAAEVRTQNLLQRTRSRFGTVLTGFRGFFTNENDSNARKTLLGE